MKINSITLENFGSYEGITRFDTAERDGKNIILIGGKNGAGKTTLFTAMRLCLYGYMSMGYKNNNAYYYKAISKLINNYAKLIKPAKASVSMEVGISNGHELDIYSIKRSWVLSETVEEKLTIEKNGEELTKESTADFEKFLLNIVPPELFNLYFFDGEKIADFFLEEGSNARIKNAFLTLCGYDTFEIMSKNFKRVASVSESSDLALKEYMEAKEFLEESKEKLHKANVELNDCLLEIANTEFEIKALDEAYSKRGGITQEEWNEKLATIKYEEKQRENLNAWLKKVANDVIPFLIVKDKVEKVRQQVLEEENNRKYKSFCEILDSQEINNAVTRLNFNSEKILETLKESAYTYYGSDAENILDLSFEENAIIMGQINSIIDFDQSKIKKAKNVIKNSIAKCGKIREELEKCNIDSVQTYMKNRADLFEKKSSLLNNQLALEENQREKEEQLLKAEDAFEKHKNQLEVALKKESINDIAAKSILMLDKLQDILYHKQLSKVEEYFRKEINVLMRKTKFIDDISIDDDFGVHIFRHEEYGVDKLKELMNSIKNDQNASFRKTVAYQDLCQKAGDEKNISAFLNANVKNTLELPVEIDKTSLSNGEKQIFIMALYYSMVKLCNHEMPFIIDTPFARIDTEHRKNIAEHFFSALDGQVFILSTNEEIDSRHVEIMKDKIASRYMLENQDNKRTTVVRDSYFEV